MPARRSGRRPELDRSTQDDSDELAKDRPQALRLPDSARVEQYRQLATELLVEAAGMLRGEQT